MELNEALEIVQAISRDNDETLFETLDYMDRNLFQFDSQQRMAFRVAFPVIARVRQDTNELFANATE